MLQPLAYTTKGKTIISESELQELDDLEAFSHYTFERLLKLVGTCILTWKRMRLIVITFDLAYISTQHLGNLYVAA